MSYYENQSSVRLLCGVSETEENIEVVYNYGKQTEYYYIYETVDFVSFFVKFCILQKLKRRVLKK